MNNWSHAPLFDDLGVAGDDLNASIACGERHRLRNPAQQIDRQPLLDNHRAGEIERHGTAGREVVDRAIHRELADIAAGEEQRIDDVGIGGEGEPIAAHGQLGKIETGLVLQGGQGRVVEGAHKDVVDQILHRLAAPAMGKRHFRHMQLAEPPGPGRGDGAHAAPSRRTPPYW